MGWDAYATMPDGSDLGREFRKWVDAETGDTHESYVPAKPEYREAFVAAFRRARAVTGDAADHLLPFGGLDCSACAKVLEEASGLDPYGDPWAPAVAWAVATFGQWPKAEGHEAPWAVASAYEFLTTCAALGLGTKEEGRWMTCVEREGVEPVLTCPERWLSQAWTDGPERWRSSSGWRKRFTKSSKRLVI